jgi:pimeloyl-ACP methyl ester carboxylesterase
LIAVRGFIVASCGKIQDAVILPRAGMPGFFEAPFNTLLHDFDDFTEGYDYRSILVKIDCPLLFLRGETKLGALMTDDEISWLQTNFANVQCIRVDGVGHLLHLQDEGQTPVLNAMRAFLERF